MLRVTTVPSNTPSTGRRHDACQAALAVGPCSGCLKRRLLPGAVAATTAPPPPDLLAGWSPIGLFGDDEGKGVPLPFDFPFYCHKYKKGFQAFVDTNGYITFSKNDTGMYDSYYAYYAETGQVAPYW